jgi:hypothetical protein
MFLYEMSINFDWQQKLIKLCELHMTNKKQIIKYI